MIPQFDTTGRPERRKEQQAWRWSPKGQQDRLCSGQTVVNP